jgi:hypothetical protein
MFQRGMNYVSWPPDFDSNASNASLAALKATSTGWVGIDVFWYQDNISSTSIFPTSNSPSNESVATAILRCHELGMKVFLKPMVDPLDGNWRGEIPATIAWFASYGKFIDGWASFSQANSVDLLCIGCEFNGNDQDAVNWASIVSGVRQLYTGPITYAANWNEYQSISWWGLLDYMGIDAYFPLTKVADPTVEQLMAGWSPWVANIQAWQAFVGKPVLFTEIGYRSIQGTNENPGDYVTVSPVDLQEQANCYNATFQEFYNKNWFYGFYWWNWETNPSAGGNADTGYTPQNKPVQAILTRWYSEPWDRGNIPNISPVPVIIVSAGASTVLFIALAYLIIRKKIRTPQGAV